jgi:TRAP-type uncharacterized transport system fused permease subunit
VFIIPFVFAYEPALLLQGDWPQIIYSFVTTFVGVFALAGGLTGYLMIGKIGWISRILLIIGSLALVIPNKYADIIGILCLIIPIVEIMKNRVKGSFNYSNKSI